MESLLFLIFIGGLFLLISFIILLLGIIKKSSTLKRIALGFGILSTLSFGFIIFWYTVTIPSFNSNQMKDFAGIYIPNKSGIEKLNKNGIKRDVIKLTLNSDGTYEFDEIKGMGLEKKGTWEVGGVDQMFEFDTYYGTEFAIPSGSGDKSTLSFRYIIDINDRENVKRILFVKE